MIHPIPNAESPNLFTQGINQLSECLVHLAHLAQEIFERILAWIQSFFNPSAPQPPPPRPEPRLLGFVPENPQPRFQPFILRLHPDIRFPPLNLEARRIVLIPVRTQPRVQPFLLEHFPENPPPSPPTLLNFPLQQLRFPVTNFPLLEPVKNHPKLSLSLLPAPTPQLFPKDIWPLVFRFLNRLELIPVQRTCRAWRQLNFPHLDGLSSRQLLAFLRSGQQTRNVTRLHLTQLEDHERIPGGFRRQFPNVTHVTVGNIPVRMPNWEFWGGKNFDVTARNINALKLSCIRIQDLQKIETRVEDQLLIHNLSALHVFSDLPENTTLEKHTAIEEVLCSGKKWNMENNIKTAMSAHTFQALTKIPNLRTFTLDKIRFAEGFPTDVWSSMTHLTSLSIPYRNFAPFLTLNTLPLCRELQHLYLQDYYEISSTPEEKATLLGNIGQCRSLTHLTLALTWLTPQDLRFLCTCKNLISLKIMDIRSDIPTAFSALLALTHELPKLKHLEFGRVSKYSNCSSDRDRQTLIRDLKAALPHLTIK
jgi:hypothetical protein